METQNNNDVLPQENQGYYEKSGKNYLGLIILTVGCLLLARQMGVYIPKWVFSFPMLMIAFGLFIGLKHSFQKRSWFLFVFGGALFLIGKIWPEISFSNYIFPIATISCGLYFLFRPKKKVYKYKADKLKKWKIYADSQGQTSSSGDWLDSVTVFGGTKKTVISKTFKGGEITSVFGGSEINLSQADIEGRVELEITQVFGGLKLIVPPHWQISIEIDTLFGDVDDKRFANPQIATDPNKILVLKGIGVFAGVDIKSF